MERIQDVEVEMALGTTNSRMLASSKLQLATLYLKEEVLSPMMVMTWIIAGCAEMPPLKKDKVEFTLEHLIALKAEAKCILSSRYDYAKCCQTKEQPLAYAPPHRRGDLGRTWRTIGTQTRAFELTDWVQFQNFRKNHQSTRNAK